MVSKAAKGIMAGLKDALAYAEGDKSRGVAHRIAAVDVKAARKKLGLSQSRFAATFGCPLKTVQKWEQGERQPTGAARVLLRVIERRPKAVLEALQGDD
ncbi:MAG: helix-turn-helix domain-containing protein [Alphaproteobacteria bacterium]|nr:helix-turn-helix domain-containing protein [Alphaproteobacteria bacterium]